MHEHQTVLHLLQIGLHLGQRVFVVDAFPVSDPLALFIVVEIAGLGLAPQAAAFLHPDDQVIGLGRGIGIAHRGLGGAHDLGGQIDRGLIAQLNRTHGEAQHLCGVVDQRRCDTFGDHASGFTAIRNDAAVGIEEARVVDDNRRLLDLAHIVERLGHGAVAGFLALDDLHQQHLLNRREEVDADELILAHRGLRQAGDRQGGGVGGKDAILRNDRLNLLGHLGLHGRVFKHRFNDQVAAFQRIQIRCGGDQAQHRLFLLWRHFAARDALVEVGLSISFALVGGFLIAVDQHHFDTGLSRDERDACTHHASAQNAQLFHPLIFDTCRPHSAFLQRFLVEEE